MPNPLLTDPQHRRAHKLYFQGRKPADVAAILNAEYGLSLEPRQITDYAAARAWGPRRKALIPKIETRAAALVEDIAASLAAKNTVALEKYSEFLNRSARVGVAVLDKAEQMVASTSTARDLASAANAAAKGIEIYRKATGLDDGGRPPGTTIFNFEFARAGGSPFCRRAEPVEPEAVVVSTMPSDSETPGKSEESRGHDAPPQPTDPGT